MLLTTTDLSVEYEVLGIVRGNRVKAAHLGRDIMAGFKNLIGGEVKEYADLLTSVRDSAMDDMVNEAKDKGANAIIGIRFASSQIAAGMAEILVYGTAVKI
ncbi:MAG: YbjQ family protein [Clostridia bacterium]|nr:YbjQ family protein [Clostridia bacterium]